MSELQCAPLEEWMESIIDYRGKTPEKTTTGIPLITAKIIKGGRIETPSEFIAADAYDKWMRRGIPEEGDVVITTEAPLGEVAQLSKGKVALAQRVIALRGKKGLVDTTFLKYLLLSRPFQEDLEARATGTTVLGIKQSILRKIDLAFPPLVDQKAIAHILGTLDDKIELNRKTNETLEAMAKALFRSWFVDFDPVRAKAEGRPTGLPAEISDLFPDSFEDSELGEIPSGWKVSSIAGIAHVEMGQSPSGESCSTDPSGLPLLNGPTEFGEFCPTPVQYTSDPKRHCQSGYLLFCVRGSTTGRMNWSDQSYAIGRGLAAITSSDIDHTLMIRILIEDSLPALLAKATGSTFPSVSRKDIESISVSIPVPSIRYLYKEACSSAYQRMALHFKEISTLVQIRDALLPKLISGEIRIPDAEKMLEEVGV